MRSRTRNFAFFLLVAIGVASQCAQATKLTVNCDNHEPIRTALRLLATTNPQGPNTITVLGACKGNIVIKSMDRLTLITRREPRSRIVPTEPWRSWILRTRTA